MTKSVATNSLERALTLLHFVGRRPGGVTNSEISRELLIPKSTCTYILSRLENEGYLAREEGTGRYTVGLKMVALAHDALREVSLRSITEPVLYRLASETGLAANIGMLERDRILLIDRVESPDFVEEPTERTAHSKWSYYPSKPERDVGTELPLHSTAVGRVLLAFIPESEALQILQSKELVKNTPKTCVSIPEIMRELEIVRKQGYSLVDQEFHLTACGISAPIFDPNGMVCASVGIVGSRALPTWKNLPKLIEIVKTAARDVSEQLKSAGGRKAQPGGARINQARS
jgi:IclR family transcriptional regulator, KDG regulon repressor